MTSESDAGAAGLSAVLATLQQALDAARFPMPLADAEPARQVAAEIGHQLDDYLLPRLAALDAPLLAVVGGSTGAGKSTLVNSLLGRVVSRPGVIRPTTRGPVLVHSPDERRWFASDRIMPDLPRTTGGSSDARELQLVSEEGLPAGLALLDAPDIDSVVVENRELAAQLLAAADLWLFVTSAARYGDAVPWQFLQAAAERSAAVAVVLDRVPPAAMADVPAHLAEMMSERGLGAAPLFVVPESVTDEQGLLPDGAVEPLRSWLAGLAADSASRAAVVRATLDGAIESAARRSLVVASAVDGQLQALAQLRTEVEYSFAEAARAVSIQTADGTLLRGEVLARWQDFVGTGEFFRVLEQRIGWLRDRVVGVLRGRPAQAAEVKEAVETGLEALIRAEADAAAERAEGSWQAHVGGRALLTNSTEDLSRASSTFADATARAIRDWQGDVLKLVAEEGMDKRSKARFLALGVNGAGVALMIVAFAHTGGLVGAEIGVAGGTAVLAQRVLEAVFGDQAVRRLAERAKEDLDDRTEALMSAELVRWYRLLDADPVDPESADQLREASAAVERARSSGPAGPALPAQESSLSVESAHRPALDAPTPPLPVLEATVVETAPLPEVEPR